VQTRPPARSRRRGRADGGGVIGLLAAAALLTAAPAEPTPYELGRASFFTGLCMNVGWDGTHERAVAYAEAYDARNPTDDMEGRQAETMRGIEDAQTEVNALLAAFQASRDVAAFKDAITSRCDAVVRDFPAILGRTDGTEAAFDAFMTDVVNTRGEN